MSDMTPTIVPKSDQLNSDDLISGPITIKITGVTIKSGEQPVSIFYEGDNGKPYKCCKSMARIMVAAWGADSKRYVGRSLTLYRDPDVKWAGMAVGGIRISHMSDIADDMTMALTVTRSNRKPFTVRPLVADTKAAPRPPSPASPPPAEGAGAAPIPTINEAQESAIIDLLELAGLSIADFNKQAGTTKILDLQASRFDGAVTWIKSTMKPEKSRKESK